MPAALRGQRAVLLNCVDRDADLPSVMPDDVMGGRVGGRRAAGRWRRTDGIYVVGEDPSDAVVAGPRASRACTSALGAAGVSLAGVVPCDWAVTRGVRRRLGRWLDDGRRPRA